MPESETYVNDALLQAGHAPDTWMMLLKTVFFLVLVVGLFVFVMKALARKRNGWMRGRAIRSVGGVMLGQGKSVQLIEIGHSLYVVGVGEDVHLIQTIDDPEEVAYITASLDPATAPAPAAMRLWSQWFKREKQRAGDDEQVSATSFETMLQQQLGAHRTNRQKQLDDVWQTPERSDDR